MTLTKADARQEALRRFRALPEDQRKTFEQAQVIAAAFTEDVDFPTLCNTRKLTFSWLVKEMSGLPPWGNVPPEH